MTPGTRRRPALTFASELPGGEFARLVADPATVAALTQLRARVAVAVLDRGDQRAEAVRLLNRAGVPVVAWLLVSKEDGYYFTLDNAREAAAAYEDFRGWSQYQGLSWDAVAFDLEPALQELQRLRDPRAWPALLRVTLARARDGDRLRRGSESYARLIERIQAEGLPVHCFQFPFLVDDRLAGSTLVHRITSAPRVLPDRDILMLYTSYLGRLGPSVLASYGEDADMIAVGSTGGGVDPDSWPKLGWGELVRDLRTALRFTDDIAVFSLEGCVRQGMLRRLNTVDWALPPPSADATLRLVEAVRLALRAILEKCRLE